MLCCIVQTENIIVSDRNLYDGAFVEILCLRILIMI
jgi:hypothetical protein